MNEQLKQLLEAVEGALAEYLPPPDTTLHRAMRYSVLAKGKRLRPLLVLTGAEAAGGEAIRMLPAACALEVIHAYTLIHDDLPAMDDDDLRRGQPTCHKVFGEATAILAGDALQTLGFELLALLAKEGEFSSQRVLEAVSVVARACGSRGLVAGQALDMEAQGRPATAEQVEQIHKLKTGCLFQAAVECGAILAGADEARRSRLTKYAEHFGLAFQVTDDILDLVGDSRLMGKTVGSDLNKDKATFPGVLGLEAARDLAARETRACLEALADFGREADSLRELAGELLERQR